MKRFDVVAKWLSQSSLLIYTMYTFSHVLSTAQPTPPLSLSLSISLSPSADELGEENAVRLNVHRQHTVNCKSGGSGSESSRSSICGGGED